MIKAYTITALCRAEGAIGQFEYRTFEANLEDSPHPWMGRPMPDQAIAALRCHGYETLAITVITAGATNE